MLASVLVSILFAAGGHARPRATHAARAATNELPVKSGIVSFGDSYGAGLGTGTTSGDSCRVGSNNYAELVWRYMDKPDIKLQKLVCTGDTTKELSAKIDKWQNPKDYDMATLSVGGNDLGFSDIVDACFLRIVLGTPTKGYDEDCDNAKKKANALLADSSSDGIKAKLTSSYKKILTKSGRDDFHIYATGYAEFFNADTEICNDSTFSYWNPSYQPGRKGVNVYLDKALRAEMNSMLNKFNDVIKAAIDQANHDHGSTKVHYVDVNSRFTGHRWCEGSTKEPDPNNKNTYFFLSAWPDVEAEGVSVSSQTDDAELKALGAAKKVNLPDPKTCSPQMVGGADPVQVWSCMVAKAVQADPNGEAAKHLKAANAALAKGDVNSQDVPWFLPTRQIKTFHPRTNGMVAYRDAVIDSVKANQGANANNQPSSKTTSAPKTTLPPNPLCVPHLGSDGKYVCQCSTGTIVANMPIKTGSDLCDYTALTTPKPPAPTTAPAKQPYFTLQDPWGDAVECSKWKATHYGDIPATVCDSPMEMVKWASPTAAPKCAGETTEHHFDRDSAAGYIKDNFCPDIANAMKAQKDGPKGVVHQYGKGAEVDPGQMEVSITWQTGFDLSISSDDCVDFLTSKLLDACDPKTGPFGKNVFNWKAGGTLQRGPLTFGLKSLGFLQAPPGGGGGGHSPELKAIASVKRG